MGPGGGQSLGGTKGAEEEEEDEEDADVADAVTGVDDAAGVEVFPLLVRARLLRGSASEAPDEERRVLMMRGGQEEEGGRGVEK